ncbi:ribosomal biogenesis regulatory protein [Saitoella complicata NRRL Y-17804]|uniref:ribosomal biogenesis regulatory protein n=1 Tax=Saitoella complicata (strain BCRC 22490 / CBS 7301 / JCM 7358 / NBRC 10748 / NRRL Y-17804) TaxID=698492 RepID=UPI000867CE59|nr:ribosomal biogenesis regulatory protein [Saitoella complicata NRRL Y-17804]ODQ50922.1 ribosomal biogenesis regulatory protein [Saitoella complicata NRRL Y-17804]
MAPAASEKPQFPVTVDLPIPAEYDMGNLLVMNPNPLPPTSPSSLEQTLLQTTRDGAQLLINQILSLPMSATQDGVFAALPDAVTLLPREKPLPKPKEETRWERFARQKGIAPKKREGKMVYDEATGEWVPKWGYGGKNKDSENDWLVEVNEKTPGGEGGDDVRGAVRKERKERVKKNEMQQERNMREGAAKAKAAGRVEKGGRTSRRK